MDPSNIYLIEQNKLLEALKNISDIEKQRKLLNDFTQKFTTLPSVWLEWLRLEAANPNKNPKEFTNFANKLRKTALSHFFEEYFLFKRYLGDGVFITHPNQNKTFRKVITCPYFSENSYEKYSDDDFLQQLEADLQYPHRHLEAVYHRFNELSPAFVSSKIKKTFERNIILYKKLISAFENDNAKEWLKLLLETKDLEIIIQNMEYYISKKPFQKNAWKIYIEFLKEMPQKAAMLDVYSRYCRFFVDDEEIKMKYHYEIQGLKELADELAENYICDFPKIKANYPNNLNDLLTENEIYKFMIKKIRLNLFENQKSIETLDSPYYANVWFLKNVFPKIFDIRSVGKRVNILYIPNILNENLFTSRASIPPEIIWKKAEIKNQRFSFCTDIIRYISNNYECRQKLYQTCKYFYAKYQTPICHKLMVCKEEPENIYTKNSLLLPAYHRYFDHIKDSVLLQMLLATTLNISVNWKLFAKITSSLKDCRIKYLTLYSQNITLKDIQLLNYKNNLISITLNNVNIFVDETKTENATMEDVINCLSTLKYIKIDIPTILFTPFTAEKLANLPKNTKFQKFMMYHIRPPFDAKYICEFLKKHTSPNCLFCFKFHHDHFANQQPGFHTVIKECLQNWEPKHEVPIISDQR